MPRLRIAATVTALLALAAAPAAARAAVTTTQITSWTTQNPTTSDDPYLISLDNAPATTLTVKGDAPGANAGDAIDVVCYYGATPTVAKLGGPFFVTIVKNQPVFDTGAVALKPIAGHACRLRAIPANTETGPELSSSFAAQQVAVSEAARGLAISSGVNAGLPFNYYVNDVTFTGYSVWSAVGTPVESLPKPYTGACGGPQMAPIDAAFDVGNFSIDCTGSLLSDDLGAFGGRSEVQVDGHNAYDAAAAQSLFTSGSPISQNLSGFPTTLGNSLDWDPTTGLISSTATEPFVECDGPNEEKPTATTCPSFVDSGVELRRTTTTSDGGRVITMTDTWSSTDGKAHALSLLYDNAIGVVADPPDGEPGYEFPGQSSFSAYSAGETVPGPSSGPGSVLVRSNVDAPDGDPTEADGAVTFGTAASEFAFTGNDDFEEQHVLVVPAVGSTSLSYVYSVGYTVSDVTALALAAQDRFEPLSLIVGSPADGMTTSSPAVTMSGIANAGSGVTSVVVGGQAVPVAPDGTWSAQVRLSPGTNSITAVATDGAGATTQAQVAIVYDASPASLGSPGSPGSSGSPGSLPAAVRCKVPRIKGMKLSAAEKAVRRAHCKVGHIKQQTSRTVGRGRVMSTSPRAGSTFDAGHKVELFVSKGR